MNEWTIISDISQTPRDQEVYVVGLDEKEKNCFSIEVYMNSKLIRIEPYVDPSDYKCDPLGDIPSEETVYVLTDAIGFIKAASECSERYHRCQGDKAKIEKELLENN